jgi:alpha-1,2-mannosyltransferase
LHSFHELLKTHPEYGAPEKVVKLVLVGGSRNAEDMARVEGLRRLAEELGISVCSVFFFHLDGSK